MKKYHYNICQCPINKEVYFLCRYGNAVYEIIGTLTTDSHNGTIIRGKCINGDPEIFYRSALIAWTECIINEEVAI